MGQAESEETVTVDEKQVHKYRGPTFIGKMGVEYDETGEIIKVLPGQAKGFGVQVGWTIDRIDGIPFNSKLLLAKSSSSTEYCVTFLKSKKVNEGIPLVNPTLPIERPSGKSEPERELSPRELPKAKREIVSVAFAPGTLGVTADWCGGLVKIVAEGCQAQRQGVSAGMYFNTIDGKPYTEALLDEKVAGDKAYLVTFIVVPPKDEAISPPCSSSIVSDARFDGESTTITSVRASQPGDGEEIFPEEDLSRFSAVLKTVSEDFAHAASTETVRRPSVRFLSEVSVVSAGEVSVTSADITYDGMAAKRSSAQSINSDRSERSRMDTGASCESEYWEDRNRGPVTEADMEHLRSWSNTMAKTPSGRSVAIENTICDQKLYAQSDFGWGMPNTQADSESSDSRSDRGIPDEADEQWRPAILSEHEPVSTCTSVINEGGSLAYGRQSDHDMIADPLGPDGAELELPEYDAAARTWRTCSCQVENAKMSRVCNITNVTEFCDEPEKSND